ncbi:hypothetical protein E2542_SST27078 [Spatholobus suberectus]|nr:hypothetical protein E2542_SST27078 [Spatholobus suberectus]
MVCPCSCLPHNVGVVVVVVVVLNPLLSECKHRAKLLEEEQMETMKDFYLHSDAMLHNHHCTTAVAADVI